MSHLFVGLDEYTPRMPRQKAPQGWEARPAIVVDTREPEHTAYDFSHLGAKQIRAKLDEGDYSLLGLESLVICERKEVHDLFACIGRERERFERCLERMAEIANKPNGYACVIVEATMQEVAAGLDISLVSGKAAIGSCLSWSMKYGIPFHFCGDRRHAIAATAKLLEKFYDGRIKPGLEASDIL